MARRTRTRRVRTEIAFEAISIEGGLVSPEWLARVAQLAAPSQSEADYHVPKGLNLRDEIGRYWRVAQAHWAELRVALNGDAARLAATERFVFALLRDTMGFSSLVRQDPVMLGDRLFPIPWSAKDGRVPVVIAPAGTGLDGQLEALGDGNRRRSAFGLVQEYLNAEDAALWGLATDGLKLRLVRDNASLTRPAWIEVDLARIFEEELYADFAASWLIFHASRFGAEGHPVDDCPLEAWREAGREQGTRAREHLRAGVEDALAALGQGFLSHPDNTALRVALRDGDLTTDGFFGELLRLAYRLIFLLTVEERDLLHPRRTSQEVRELYAAGYGLRRLRDRAVRRSAHDRHGDLWQSTRIVFVALAKGEPRLGLLAFGGLFEPNHCPYIDAAALQNRALMQAIFRLGWLKEDAGLVRVNWRDMGPEELGSVYESLLELAPRISQDGRTFSFVTSDVGRATARKETGSYYTPDSLVQALLDVSLEPVIQRTLAQSSTAPVRALLKLTVVDPACGSGHFLLAAARRIATHVARCRADGTPSADQYRQAVRDVVGRCVYGVDLNSMAVELCRVALWMEAVVPGQPLSFLDAHIRHGNALVGTTSELMANGVPDDAWTAVEGDDKPTTTRLRNENKTWRQVGLFQPRRVEGSEELAALSQSAEEAPDDSLDAVHAKASAWADYVAHPAVRRAMLLADLWCAAFFWPKVPGEAERAAPVRGLWEQIKDNPATLPDETASMLDELKDRYHFFHWPIAFPHVFARGGFDVVLGNPPWDTLSPDAKEFFARWAPEIRQQKSGEQTTTIAALCESPDIARDWDHYRRRLFTWVHFLKRSGRFALYAKGNLGKGDFNVYRMFVETALVSVRQNGYAAQVVPDGLYSGANTAAIRKVMFEDYLLDPLLGFENSAGVWFPGVHRSQKLCIYAAQRVQSDTQAIRARFAIRTQADLAEALSGTLLRIPTDLIREFSPDALAVMEFADQVDIDIAAKMYKRWPKFGEPCEWWDGRPYMAEIHMGNDRELFSEDPSDVPLYEGRMVSHYDHRAKGYREGRGRAAVWEELTFNNPDKGIQPQWFIPWDKVPEKARERSERFRIGFCDVASPTNERALTAAILPNRTLCGHKVPTILFMDAYIWVYPPLLGCLNSFTLDFLVRKKVGLSMTFTIFDSLPIPRFSVDHPAVAAMAPRVLQLTCTGPEMTPFWNAMAAYGWVDRLDPSGPVPGVLDEDERLRLMAEIEVIVARDLFRLTPDEIAHVLDTFPIVERRQTEKYGSYKTRDLVEDLWSALPSTTNEPVTRTNSRPRPTAMRRSGEPPGLYVQCKGYTDLVTKLLARLRSGGSCVLLGPHGSGRTTVAGLVADQEKLRTRTFNLSTTTPGTRVPWITPDTLAAMLEPSLGDEVSAAARLREQWLAMDPSETPILIFDDAGGLVQADLTAEPTIFTWLRGVGQECASILYIASRADWRKIMRVARREQDTSFGNDVRIFQMPSLEEAAARELITRRDLDPALQDRALRLGGRWPFWLRQACLVLQRDAHEGASDGDLLLDMLRASNKTRRSDWVDLSDDALNAVRRVLADESPRTWPSRVLAAAREEGIIDDDDHEQITIVNPPLCQWVRRLMGEESSDDVRI